MEKMMKLPVEVQQVIQEYANMYPLPVNNEEGASNWTHALCQQLNFSFPSAGWGHKSAGPGRPHSKDVVCTMNPFIGWDVVLAAGGPNPTLQLNGDSIDLSGQIFEPVSPVDYLGSTPPPPPNPPTDIEAKLDYIIQMMQKYHTEEMDAITAPRVTRMG
jgi:hypothetical protein